MSRLKCHLLVICGDNLACLPVFSLDLFSFPRQRVGRASASPAPPAPPALEHDPREAALRLATGRVQEEIQEATRREIELRDEGKEITTSEETVDEKVRALNERRWTCIWYWLRQSVGTYS